MLVISELGPQLTGQVIDPVGMRDRVIADIRRHLSGETGISRDDRERLTSEIADDILGYGPLERLLADDSITEIMVNGPGEIWIERQGRLYETTVRFSDDSHLRRIINRMVAQIGRRIDESSPMVDARLPDGSRVNAIIAPLSLSGPLLTIRKFARKRLGLQDMVNIGSLSEESVDFLRRCIQAQLNVLISGGTGSGKTTLLNALSSSIPDHERIVTIEDAAELQLHQRHVLRLEARPPNIEGEGAIPIRDLVRNSLRMRPDRIIVGECRGAEALDMLQAMNTGHDGSLSTVHANAPRDALARIETMVLMAGYDLPVRAIRQQVSSALDMIVHIERMEDGSRRCTAITEVQRMESRRDHPAGHLRVQDRELLARRDDQRQAPRDGAATGLPRQVREARRRAARRPVLASPDPHERRGPPPVSPMSRWTGLALVALAASARRLPGVRRRGVLGVQVVEAGTANFPDRTYVVSLPPGQEVVGTPDVTVTEDGKPVKGLAVLSSASASGIGTVLLIDASNSMKGSIEGAMEAARTFAARNPGQPLSVVFFNAKPTVALPFSTDKAEVQAALAKAPKLAEGTHIYDALAAAVAQVRGSGPRCGPHRPAVRRRRRRQCHEPGAGTVAAQGREDPRVHGRARVARLHARRARAIADETGGTFASASSPHGARRHLRRARLQAGQRVRAPLPIRRRAPSRPSTSWSPSRARARVVRVREPRERHLRSLRAGVLRQADPVVAAPAR